MFTKKQQKLLLEVLDKHLDFVTANYRNINSSSMNNLKRADDMKKKLDDLRAVRSKIESGDFVS